jgi:hypothetical protein
MDLVRPLGLANSAGLDWRQAEWVNRLALGIKRSELETTARVLAELSARLEGETEPARSAA